MEKLEWFSDVFLDVRVTDSKGRVWKKRGEVELIYSIKRMGCELEMIPPKRRGDYELDLVDPQSGRVLMTVEANEEGAIVKHIICSWRDLIKEEAKAIYDSVRPRDAFDERLCKEKRMYFFPLRVSEAVLDFFSSQKGKGKDER